MDELTATNVAENFHFVLLQILLANCPVDTRNMVSNISLEDHGDYYTIQITAINNGYDYARAVNYNPQRTPKEIKNFMWVERSIKQACEVIGSAMKYELS